LKSIAAFFEDATPALLKLNVKRASFPDTSIYKTKMHFASQRNQHNFKQ